MGVFDLDPDRTRRFAGDALATPPSIAVGSAAVAATAPTMRFIVQSMNKRQPNVAPPLEMLFDMYARGGIGDLTELDQFASTGHGVKLLGGMNPYDSGGWESIWRRALRFLMPTPEPRAVVDMHRTGKLQAVAALGLRADPRAWLERAGVAGAYWQKYLLDTDAILPVDAILELFWRGAIPDAASAKVELARAGVLSPARQEYLLSRGRPLPTEQVMDALRRSFVDDDKAKEMLSRQGIHRQEDFDLAKKLGQNIPGYQDIIRIAVKEGWNDPVAARFGYDEEFPEEFAAWMKQLGYDWSEDVTLPGGRVIPGKTWSRLLWRSHWANLAPGQAYEMEWRLNEENIWRWQNIFPGIKPWTQDDVATVLKINDYPLAFRDRLQAISYNRLGVRGLQRIIKAVVDNPRFATDRLPQYSDTPDNPAAIIEDFATFQARDSGLAPDDAELLGAAWRADYERQAGAARRKEIDRMQERRRKQVYDLFRSGLLAKGEAQDRLVDGLGVDGGIAMAELDRLEGEEAIRSFKELRSRVRSDYYAGIVTRPQAIDRLQSAGMTPEAARLLTSRWEIAFNQPRRQFATEKVIKLVTEGFLSGGDARARLTTLGWSNPDTLLLLAEAQQTILKNQAKAIQGQQRQRLAAARALEKQIRDQRAQTTKFQGELQRLTPRGMLKRLLKKDKISQAYFRRRYSVMGLDKDTATLDIIDAIGQEKLENGQAEPEPQPASFQQRAGVRVDERAGVRPDERAGEFPRGENPASG